MANILLVEDDIYFADMLGANLEDMGHAVTRATDGLAALKRRIGITGRLGLLRKLRKWNVTYRERPAQASGVGSILRTAFADDVSLLERLLQRDLGHWLRDEGPSP